MFVQRFAKGVAIVSVMALRKNGVTLETRSFITIVVVAGMIPCSVYAGNRFRDESEARARTHAASAPA